MPKYAAIIDNTIKAISDVPFTGNGLTVIDIPLDLQDKTLAELILTCRIRDGKLLSKCKGGKFGKVALVSNWKMRCGISTYAEHLYAALIPHLPDFKLFIEQNPNPTSDIHQTGVCTLTDAQISMCWERGKPLDNLIAEIKAYDPDVVLINHEYGLFPNARYWLSLLTQLSEYRVITTLHSVFPGHQDKTVIEASMSEAIVHLEGAKIALANKGINAKVSVIPHGCYSADQTKLWNIYRSGHTFVQSGFGLRYKRFDDSISATAILRDRGFNDVFFTGLFSETDFGALEHESYFNDLMALIGRLEVQGNVALIRGFQSDQVINSYLRTNAAAVFPYGSQPQHEVYGASGAARLAMAAGIPVITSSVHHFEDLPTIKADGAVAIADALEKLFTDKTAKKEQVELQNQHISANGWDTVAKQYLDLLNGGA